MYCDNQGRILDLPKRGDHGERERESVECEPITGVWGQSPKRGPGAEFFFLFSYKRAKSLVFK